MAEIGKLAFFDPSLSASGKQSCASCHNPEHAYGPTNGLAVQLGGSDMKHHGTRAVPSLRYLRRVPVWTHTYASSFKERLEDGDNMPSGGYTWDGRFDRPADQAAFPLLNPDEMANADAADVTAKLSKSAYAARFREVFGQDIGSRPADALAALGKALERFQFDDPSFQPFDSKFDQVLDGKAAFSQQEARGFALFNDPDRGNCASCHLVDKGAAGAHPVLTDYNFQTLGVPRNPEIAAMGIRDTTTWDCAARSGSTRLRISGIAACSGRPRCATSLRARCSSTTAVSTRWKTPWASMCNGTPIRRSGIRIQAASSTSTTCR
ncbi:cytochrome-c peroxidase [Caballeronia sp. S22]|uniref:cytochrome-c peroxidase n=1 Tax=Caballeronia sp. S22 TaxID=3137182 RepID=UPI0035311320